MTTKERVLKFTIMQRRNANLTEEEFRTYWTTKHAPVASAWFARNNILGYRQYHTPKLTRDLAKDGAEGFGWQISPYDGHVEILVRSMDDLLKATQDPEYEAKIGPDEKRFLDQERSMVTVGWEEVYVRDGKVNIDEDGGSMYAQL